ncbi:MAG TPA: uracil-DNA glycosylase family protein [Stellaceae bacterium]|nr:uracil-DNA glycosylase family protein [Stellaceae bacterium]
MDDAFDRLIAEIRGCTLCAAHLPLGPRPVVRGRPSARLLIISQAPGQKAHHSGLSFDDRSGERLREWLGLNRAVFWDESRVAIMPLGFCYPGRAPGGGDRPPRPECAPHWHGALRSLLPAIELTLLVGSYAIRHYLPQTRARPAGEAIAQWRDFLPDFFPLPHPSWRVALWQRQNPWFETEVLPELRARLALILGPHSRSAPCHDR